MARKEVMLSFSTIKDVVNLVGAPAAAVIVVFTFFSVGWVPFATQGSETLRAVSANASALTDLNNAVALSREQHRAVLEQMEDQNDAMLSAFREICFGVAKSQERMRACGNIGSLPHSHHP
jgi:hypothetical protein